VPAAREKLVDARWEHWEMEFVWVLPVPLVSPSAEEELTMELAVPEQLVELHVWSHLRLD
jgi:hypothetical protein